MNSPVPADYPFDQVLWRKSTRSGNTNCVELAELPWRKSSYSANTNCVELTPVSARVGVRDSKHPAQHPLVVGRGELNAFLRSAKAGAFDLG